MIEIIDSKKRVIKSQKCDESRLKQANCLLCKYSDTADCLTWLLPSQLEP